MRGCGLRGNTSRDDDEGTAVPPVIGPERAGQEAGMEPQQAYVPCQSVSFAEDEAVLELRTTDDELTALVVFSSPETLVEGCGEKQVWVTVPVAELEDLRQRTCAAMVLWDVLLPEDQRKH